MMQKDGELLSDQLGKVDESERADKLLRIDTAALLKVIRELEIKLSDHHRQVIQRYVEIAEPNSSKIFSSILVRIKYLRGQKL